ncbi:hypothetical protein [Neobacillus sp. NPDC093127]|uniref:hypothetical protein n=1 Tax=Neobacillus sp. NPDC093127 TaxID=3364296 RepID=UPI003827E16B
MKHVVIEMRKGEPVVVSCPKKIQVIIRKPKKRSFKKRIKTMAYRVKIFLGVQ